MKKLSKLFLILISLFIFNPIALAEEFDDTSLPTTFNETKERTKENNYGVNKKWNITSNNLNNIKKTPYVDANEKIFDYANVLTDEEKQQLKEEIDAFINKYQTELVIVTNSMPYNADGENEVWAADFYDYNDFGLDYENYSGILLYRNTYEKNPYYDMYTFGDAQFYFDDSRYNYILNKIYSDLHSGDYITGFTSFISYCDMYYKEGKSDYYDNYELDENGYLHKKYSVPYLIIIIISAIVTSSLVGVNVSKNKMIKKETTATQYLNRNSITYHKKLDNFIRKHVTHYTIQSSSGGSGGGHSSHGSSGGGHSSGGGRHG